MALNGLGLPSVIYMHIEPASPASLPALRPFPARGDICESLRLCENVNGRAKSVSERGVAACISLPGRPLHDFKIEPIICTNRTPLRMQHGKLVVAWSP